LTFAAVLLLPSLVCGADTNVPRHVQYEPAIRAFEASDKTNPPPKDAVVFIGSSSIRMWKTAPEQFPNHRVIMRGFGGSHLSDSVEFADRIVIPYRPRLVLIYAGDNDVNSGKTPERVLADFQAFVTKVHAALPETRIGYIAIKPSPSRMKHFEQFKTTNRLIREYTAANEKLLYVDVFTPTLGSDGQPRADLFVKDMLHLNEAGYKLWAGIVTPVLDKVVPSKPKDR
jgi:hypothetical protein